MQQTTLVKLRFDEFEEEKRGGGIIEELHAKFKLKKLEKF